MGAGAIGRRQVEQAEARVEAAGILIFAGLEVGFGDFELRRLGELTVARRTRGVSAWS